LSSRPFPLCRLPSFRLRIHVVATIFISEGCPLLWTVRLTFTALFLGENSFCQSILLRSFRVPCLFPLFFSHVPHTIIDFLKSFLEKGNVPFPPPPPSPRYCAFSTAFRSGFALSEHICLWCPYSSFQTRPSPPPW